MPFAGISAGVPSASLRAFMQHGDALGQLENRVHVVVDRRSMVRPLPRFLIRSRTFRRVARAQAGERFVEQQHRGRGGEREADF